jgi:ATP-dependent Clp protease ATP-binding subunit ClpB
VVDFRNTVLIMTSNLGSHLIMDAGPVTSEEGWAAIEDRVRGELRNHFRPEFLNRVDEVVVFHPLSRRDIDQIVDLQLGRLDQLLAERHLTLRLTPAARELLADQGYDPVFGARPLKRAIQRYLQNPMAMTVLEGGYRDGDTILADREGDHLGFRREAKEEARSA